MLAGGIYLWVAANDQIYPPWQYPGGIIALYGELDNTYIISERLAIFLYSLMSGWWVDDGSRISLEWLLFI